MTSATRKFAYAFGVIALLTVAWIGSRLYALRMEPLTEKTAVIKLPRTGDMTNVLDSLLQYGIVTDTSKLIAAIDRYGLRYRPGQFEIEENWSAKKLIDHLRAGAQEEARVVLTNARLIGDVAAKATRFIELDSAELHDAVLDSVWLDSVGLTRETAMTIFVPNTYNVYWSASGKEVRDRLYNESKRFWDKNDRRSKADSLGLTPEEVYTVASIVESESNHKPEKPTIAGVYLNRLRLGIKLDADPTVIFAIGDYGIRRVLFKHLEYDSPYNTYLYAGVPPGPISMAGISSIDAVLNPEQHDYLFFVTKGDGTGTHMFAKNMSGHSRNIRTFQQTLRRRGIRR
ncbi:MAG: endolytic transglycosylase MltG [Saprospiraceae bacterium]